MMYTLFTNKIMHIHYQKIIFARQGGVSDPHALAASGSVGMGNPWLAKMSKNYM